MAAPVDRCQRQRRPQIPRRQGHPPAFAALKDPVSRTYYGRKRAEGKKHNAAIIRLARRRCDVLYAMIRDKAPYAPPVRDAA